MRHTLPISAGLVVIAIAAACGGGPPPPPPGPDPDSLAAAQAEAQRVRDSIAQARAREDSIARERQRILAEQRQAREDSIAAVREETNRVRNMLARRVHFDFDRSNIRTGEDTAILDEKLAILQRNPNLRIQITGHCDERGSDEYNIALGNRRALSAKRYLTDRGIAESRIMTTSMGEERPIAMGSTEEAWAQNRRDEFTIVSGGNELKLPGM